MQSKFLGSFLMNALVAEDLLSAEARNSAWWCDYFNAYDLRQRTIPWDRLRPLTADVQRVLIPSLQDFQLGESSEGRNGMARAAAYGRRVRDPHYAEAIRLFFAEENRHAEYLARYLRRNGAELIGKSWTDFVFRRVRRLLGLEMLLTVLLTAELIGEVYYRAIRSATACPALRTVCTQLLSDERMHVRFHIERFRFLRRHRGPLRRTLQDRVWWLFFTATRVAVWTKHRRAFRLGGKSLGRFWSETGRSLRRCIRQSNA
jgi:hypothetical protein